MSDQHKSPWNSLEIAKLLASLMTPLLLFWLGYQMNQSFRAADAAREQAAKQTQRTERELEKIRQLSQTRQAAVLGLSRFIYERRTRAELLFSALKRHGDSPTDESKKELSERKRLYDDAYFNWNANHQSNLLLIRQLLGADQYSTFEGMVEFRLVKLTFTPLDKCLTVAYDTAIRKGDPRPILAQCKASQLIQRALDCGYAITDELFKLSGANADEHQAESIVDSRCPSE